MIRIDEIYNNTLWPWIQENLPGKRLFFCDPPGNTNIENVFNMGNDDITENGYFFLHDQEPVNLMSFRHLFREIKVRNDDLYKKHFLKYHPEAKNKKYFFDAISTDKCKKIGGIIVSELGDNVNELEKYYHWNTYYYFFHGWASLDWYRGYNRTFLQKPKDLEHTFLSLNNIIGGDRRHRLELFLELENRNLIRKNLISFPKVCPHENVSVQKLCEDYNLKKVTTELPLILDSFKNHANNSHMLNIWEYSAKSLLQVVTETIYHGNRLHLTEKTFKPIAMSQPFILVSCKHSLQYLRQYGFETFSSVWDESYDTLPDEKRIEAIGSLLEDIEHSNCREWLSEQCAPIVEHNFNHFYGGGFEKILWKELTDMLEQLSNDFRI